MNKPLFEIGETVIIYSEKCPQRNGENLCIFSIEDFVGEDRLGRHYEGFIYSFEGLPDEWWTEPTLRKKHQPSEMNFNELMSSLNAPITTW